MGRTSGVTDREHDVLNLVAGHLTNAEIAERLFVSTRTVESHVSSLIRKLEVTDRRGLVRRADELGLLGPRRRGRWPTSFGGFLGRAGEVATLTDLLARHRMVTVSGPGGVGKTRLTTHTVSLVAGNRRDGAWFVDLSQVSDPQAVTSAIAASVGVAEHPGHSVEDALSTVLGPADGVLVLDNCEHLVASVEPRVRRLLDDCPDVTVVATSRVRLGAGYEWVYELPGLRRDDAVQLFRARAEAAGGVVPEEPRVAALCVRLEGMALAIELAAARYPTLGLDGLSAGLDDPLRLLGTDEAARQRSLRATIAWSVALLDEDERAVFAASSVFASRFTVAAAHQVAWPDHTEADVARVLATLADHHLLRAEVGTPTTYRFQEVVRQFAAELLGGRAAEVEVRHASWVHEELTSLTTRAAPRWSTTARGASCSTDLRSKRAPLFVARRRAGSSVSGSPSSLCSAAGWRKHSTSSRSSPPPTPEIGSDCYGTRLERLPPAWWATRPCGSSTRRRRPPWPLTTRKVPRTRSGGP
jgi:predicted ATPase/DNA-binding CsgD family transcriptional regulator